MSSSAVELKKENLKFSRKQVQIASILFMGLGHIIYLKQYLKGLLYALVEIVFLISIPLIISKVSDFITLGEANPTVPIAQRDNSLFMMIDGVMVITIICAFAVAYVISVTSALREYEICRRRGSVSGAKENTKQLFENSFLVFALSPAMVLLIFFVIVPLIFSACVAFTNYSLPKHIPPNNTIDWVGMENFKSMFGGSLSWTKAFSRVARWTFIWALVATFTCYFGGFIIAFIMKENKISFGKFFRTIFILPYAIPSVISMLVWKNLLNGSTGVVNRTLIQLDIIQHNIPWLSDEILAKVVCVVINLWSGFSYFMLLTMGSMTAISEDVYEASRIDGASKWQIFKKISLPLVLYQTMPLIIMSVAHNINNFGAIYFLTGGEPVVSDTTVTRAGGTDLLVTWIYDLTMVSLKYQYASVLAVVIFIVVAPISIFYFKRTTAYKEH